MLPSDRYRLVPTAESTTCMICSARHGDGGAGLQFVSFDSGGSGVEEAPGTLEAMDPQDAAVAFRVRDGYGATKLIVEHKPMICSACLAHLAGLIGYVDGEPLRRELDEVRDQNAALAGELEEKEQLLTEAEAELRRSPLFQRLLSAPEPIGDAPHDAGGEKAAAAGGKRTRRG
jgi:hypothetical protein